MNHRKKSPTPRPKNPAYRQAFGRLDEALAENTQSDIFEKINRARRILFGIMDDSEHPGKIIQARNLSG
jgi:hypothetical protein